MDMLVSLIGFVAPVFGIAAFLLSRPAVNELTD
jgi:hypothetical protein